MRLFLTGASGLLGGNFAAVAARAGHEVVGTVGGWTGAPIPGLATQMRLELRNGAALEAAVRRARPEAIVNCAAVSDPGQCEREPELAAALNVELPRQLATLAQKLGVRLIHVSTEQVFDGSGAPYSVDDPVAPINGYARLKADSEREVVAAAPLLSAVVRAPLLMGNSPGGRRSVHERLLLDWSEGRVARLFNDEIRQVAMADNLAAVLLELCVRCELCGVFQWAGAEPVSRHWLGLAIAARFGIPAQGRVVVAHLLGTPLAATRPPDLRLDLRPLTELLSTRPEPLGPQLARLVVPEALLGAMGKLRNGPLPWAQPEPSGAADGNAGPASAWDGRRPRCCGVTAVSKAWMRGRARP
jgi:dTDP-4-dehydrorhamnose reductase